jgi:hypothetical protein
LGATLKVIFARVRFCLHISAVARALLFTFIGSDFGSDIIIGGILGAMLGATLAVIFARVRFCLHILALGVRFCLPLLGAILVAILL